MRFAHALREAARVLTGRRRIFRGWWVLAAAFTSIGLVNGVAFWSIGLFVEPLEDEFGWSRAEVSLGFSLSLGLSGLAAPMVGRWVDRRGPRSAIILGATATAGTYLLLATTENLWQWYLYMSLNGLLRHFVFIIPFMALLARWFDRRLSVAGAVLGAGLMVGGMLVVPVMRVLIDSLEWQGAFVVAGVSVLVVVPLLAVTVIRDTPADVGELPDGVPRPEGQSPGEMPGPTGGLSLRAALHTRLFWALTLGMTLYPFGMVTWVAHSAPFYESVGLSPGTAAFLISLSAALAIPPRLLAGHFADRISNLEYGAAGVALVLFLAMGILVVDTGTVAMVLFFPLFVLGFAAGGALFEALLIPRAFGVQNFATILGVVVIIQTAGFISGPTIAGAIFDATGSYDWVLVMVTAFFFATAASFAVAGRLPRPELPGKPVPHSPSDATAAR